MSNRFSLKTIFLILPLIFISAGCLTLGDDFKSSTSWIAVDGTSKGSTQKLLGEPYSAGWTSEGETDHAISKVHSLPGWSKFDSYGDSILVREYML